MKERGREGLSTAFNISWNFNQIISRMMSNVSIDKYLTTNGHQTRSPLEIDSSLRVSHEHTDSGLGADQDYAYSSERSNDSKSKYIPGMAAVFNRLPTGQMIHNVLPQTHYNSHMKSSTSMNGSINGSLNGIMKSSTAPLPKSILGKSPAELSTVSVIHQSQHHPLHHHIPQSQQQQLQQPPPPLHQLGSQKPNRYSNNSSIHVVNGSNPNTTTTTTANNPRSGKSLIRSIPSSAPDIASSLGLGGCGYSGSNDSPATSTFVHNQQSRRIQSPTSIQSGVILSAPASPNPSSTMRRRPLVVGNANNNNNNNNCGLKDNNILGGTLTRSGHWGASNRYQDQHQQQLKLHQEAKEEEDWLRPNYNPNQNLNPNDNNRSHNSTTAPSSTSSANRRYNHHRNNNNNNNIKNHHHMNNNNNNNGTDNSALVHRPPSRSSSSSSLKLILTPIIKSSKR